MVAYWIGRVRVTDPEGYGKYAELAGPAIEKHGGKFLARGGRLVTPEGEEYPRNVVVGFPLCRGRHSPEYQGAVSHAKGAADRLLCIVEGV
jgi:uncharacterized protein (DUF1330 family)